MENRGSVSVIIPVYQVARYLVEALDSVVRQTYTNLEIILIDDGSTDGSGEICDRYAATDHRIRVVHQENKGLSAARNAGLDLMNGDAVAFLDSDEAYDPEYIETAANAMIREQADLVVCGFSSHKTTGRMTRKNRIGNGCCFEQGVYDRKGALNALIDGKIKNVVWNKLYRKELFNGIRYPDGHVYEDIDTTHRLLDVCNRVCVLDRQLYMHRERPGSITVTYSQSNLRDWIEAQSHFLSYVSDHIPDVFTDAQMKIARQNWFARLVGFYTHFPPGGDKAFREELRTRIIELGHDAAIRPRRFRTKVCYRLICHCPAVIRMAAPVYDAVLRASSRSVI